jgi:hypothetical protein
MDWSGLVHEYGENLKKIKKLSESEIKETIYFYSTVLGQVVMNEQEIDKIAEISRSKPF